MVVAKAASMSSRALGSKLSCCVENTTMRPVFVFATMPVSLFTRPVHRSLRVLRSGWPHFCKLIEPCEVVAYESKFDDVYSQTSFLTSIVMCIFLPVENCPGKND